MNVIDEALGHRSYFARMLRQVHADTHDAIGELLVEVIDAPESEVHPISLQRKACSRLMLYFAVHSFLCASARYARHYGIGKAEWMAKQGRVVIGREIEAIGAQLETIEVAG